jgi:hypothetical protein
MRARRHTWLAGVLAIVACGSHTGDNARDRPADATPAATASAEQPAAASESSVTSRAGPVETADFQWEITPGHFGPISAGTSEADLRRLFGAAVKRDTIHLGEGEYWPGTILYPDDSLRRAEITWRDTVGRQRPWYIRLAGTRSVWHANGVIRLGTTLRELERLNGKPFPMSGYGWDGAGRVTEWNGGALDTALSRAGSEIYFSLFPDSAGSETKAYSEIRGDHHYLSSLPALQQLNPAVWEIFLNFPGEMP